MRDIYVRTSIGELNPKDMAYPFAYVDDEFPVEDIQYPLTDDYPLYDAGKFPDNIAKYYWIHKGEDGGSPWFCLARLTNGNYILYEASCCINGFCSKSAFMNLIVAPRYDMIIEHAMTPDIYKLYISETNKYERLGR